MALFKIFRGNSSDLENVPKNDGYCYFTPDDGKFYIDVANGDGTINRVPLNANQADTVLNGATLTPTGNNITPVYVNASGALAQCNIYTGDVDTPSGLVRTTTVGRTAVGRYLDLQPAELEASTEGSITPYVRLEKYENSLKVGYKNPDGEGIIKGTVVADLDGIAAKASKINTTTAIGSSVRPVYIASDGTVTACTMSYPTYFSSLPYIGSGGVMEIGKYIDFHTTNEDDKDYAIRLNAGDDGKLTFTGNGSTATLVANLEGKASALNLSAAVGNTVTPVYFQSNGTPAQCTIYTDDSTLAEGGLVRVRGGDGLTKIGKYLDFVAKQDTDNTYIRLYKYNNQLALAYNSGAGQNKGTLNANLDGNATNVTGVVAIANGGTGKTTGEAAANALINSLGTGTSDPVDGDYFISQYVGGGTDSTKQTYWRRPISTLWNYIKGKITTSDIKAGWMLVNNPSDPTASGMTYYKGAPKAGSSAGNAVGGSSNNYKLWSYPTTAGTSGTNMQVTRFMWSTSYWQEIYMTPNHQGMWYRSIESGVAHNWRRIWIEGDAVTGAVANDYAECRQSDDETPGYVLVENGDDTLSKATERLSHFAGVSSDTWGFSQGETEKAKTPIAVAGRVLVYPYQDRDNYKPGDCVCAAPGGTVDIMTREEVREWPDRIVGTVSCVPNYEEWGGDESVDRAPVKVNGRIWIKVR